MRKLFLIIFIVIISLFTISCGNDDENVLKEQKAKQISQLTAIRNEYFDIYYKENLKQLSRDAQPINLKFMPYTKFVGISNVAKNAKLQLESLNDKLDKIKIDKIKNENGIVLNEDVETYKTDLSNMFKLTLDSLNVLATVKYDERVGKIGEIVAENLDLNYTHSKAWVDEYLCKGLADKLYTTQTLADPFMSTYEVYGFQKGILGAALIGGKYNHLGGNYGEFILTFELANLSNNELLEITPIIMVGYEGKEKEVLDPDVDSYLQGYLNGDPSYALIMDNDDKLYPGQRAKCCVRGKVPFTADEDLYVKIKTGIKDNKNTMELPLRWLLYAGYPAKLNQAQL